MSAREREKTAITAAHRRRAGGRGAVMVEAIVVMSFFILCFLGVGYFRALYVQKLQVQRLARASAFSHAMGACKGDPSTTIARDTGARRLSGNVESGLPFDAIPKFPDVPKADFAQSGLEKIRNVVGDTGVDQTTTVTLAGDASTTSKPKPDGPEQGFRGDASSTSYVVCADTVTDDRYERMVTTIASLF